MCHRRLALLAATVDAAGSDHVGDDVVVELLEGPQRLALRVAEAPVDARGTFGEGDEVVERSHLRVGPAQRGDVFVADRVVELQQLPGKFTDQRCDLILVVLEGLGVDRSAEPVAARRGSHAVGDGDLHGVVHEVSREGDQVLNVTALGLVEAVERTLWQGIQVGIDRVGRRWVGFERFGGGVLDDIARKAHAGAFLLDFLLACVLSMSGAQGYTYLTIKHVLFQIGIKICDNFVTALAIWCVHHCCYNAITTAPRADGLKNVAGRHMVQYTHGIHKQYLTDANVTLFAGHTLWSIVRTGTTWSAF